MNNTPKQWLLQCQHMQLEVQSLGGMLGPWQIEVGNRTISPLAVAPWVDEPEAKDLPPILQRLRGEWPCVPFGITKPMDSYPDHWQTMDTQADSVIDNAIAHGYGSHHHWYCFDRGLDWIDLAIDYPKSSPIRRLRRSITLIASDNRIELSLSVETRAACALPLGLHPVLALNQEPGSCTLKPDGFTHASTYPLQFEPNSQLAIDQDFNTLSRVPQRDGTTIDLTRLPLAENREELVQLHGCKGRIALHNQAQGYTTTLQWNPEHFPSCVLWLSNRGRAEYPWRSRHLALGIEPTCSFFDLNPSICPDRLHQFAANETWRTYYSLSVQPSEI